MRSTEPEEELRDVDSSRNTTMTHEKLMSEGGIAGSIDSSTHYSTDEDSHVNNLSSEGFGVEIVAIRKVSSRLTEDEKESTKPSMTESSKPNKATKKKLLRGLFWSKRGKTKPPKPQSHQEQKEAASIKEAVIPGPSSLLRSVSVSVEIKPKIDERATTSGSVAGAESEIDDEPVFRRIVAASDLLTPAPDGVGDTEVLALAKVGEVSVSGPTLSTEPNTEPNTESFDETIEKELKTNSVVPAAVEELNLLDKAGTKVDALVDAFFLMTACGKIDAACNGLPTDLSADEYSVRVNGTGDDYTLRSDPDDDTYLTFDNSLIEDDDTLRTFLDDDGTLYDDDIQFSSEDVKRAIETLKKHALRLGVSEAELLQRIRDEQEKRVNENTRESTSADIV